MPIVPKIIPDDDNRIQVPCGDIEVEYEIVLPPSKSGPNVTQSDSLKSPISPANIPSTFFKTGHQSLHFFQFDSADDVFSSMDLLNHLVSNQRERGYENTNIVISVRRSRIDVHLIADLINKLETLEAKVELVVGSME